MSVGENESRTTEERSSLIITAYSLLHYVYCTVGFRFTRECIRGRIVLW